MTTILVIALAWVLVQICDGVSERSAKPKPTSRATAPQRAPQRKPETVKRPTAAQTAAQIAKAQERYRKEAERREREETRKAAELERQEQKEASALSAIEHYEPFLRHLETDYARKLDRYNSAIKSGASAESMEKLKKELYNNQEKMYQIRRKLEKAHFTLGY